MAIAQTDLQSLADNPREDLTLEVKSWLDLGNRDHICLLAKAIIAIANSGGGHLIIGFDEQPDGSFLPADSRPDTLDGFSQDTINGIVGSYSDPAFQVSVVHLTSAIDTKRYPIISIPGGHRVPILARRGSPDQKTLMVGHTYVRRVGPESAEPANSNEWRELLDRCIRAGRDELLDAIRGVLSPPELEPPTLAKASELQTWNADGLARWQAPRGTKP